MAAAPPYQQPALPQAAAAAADEEQRRERSKQNARTLGFVALGVLVLGLGSCTALVCVGAMSTPSASSKVGAAAASAKIGAAKPRR